MVTIYHHKFHDFYIFSRLDDSVRKANCIDFTGPKNKKSPFEPYLLGRNYLPSAYNLRREQCAPVPTFVRPFSDPKAELSDGLVRADRAAKSADVFIFFFSVSARCRRRRSSSRYRRGDLSGSSASRSFSIGDKKKKKPKPTTNRTVQIANRKRGVFTSKMGRDPPLIYARNNTYCVEPQPRLIIATSSPLSRRSHTHTHGRAFFFARGFVSFSLLLFFLQV